MKYKISNHRLTIEPDSIGAIQFNKGKQVFTPSGLLKNITPRLKLLLSAAYFLSLLISLFTLLIH